MRTVSARPSGNSALAAVWSTTAKTRASSPSIERVKVSSSSIRLPARFSRRDWRIPSSLKVAWASSSKSPVA